LQLREQQGRDIDVAKRVLMTGFEPFGGETVNAAWEAVSGFQSATVEGADIFVRQLPTVFGKAVEVLEAELAAVQPDIVLCVGEAGGRSAISIERIGVNLDHARIPDNAGNQPKERPIIPDGPTAYWSTLPVAELVSALKSAGIPAEESFSAGTFVCNHVLYSLMHRLAADEYRQRAVIGGFIHVPYLPCQAAQHGNKPCLSVEEVRRALRLVIEYLVH
jgi:pyroglutamyl-peptidase